MSHPWMQVHWAIRLSYHRVPRIVLFVIGALTVGIWSPNGAVAHSASLSSGQLLQRSMLAMRSVRNAHSQSNVHIVGPAIRGKKSEQIAASVSVDCTGTHSATRYTGAIRAAIRGTVVIGKGSPQPINMHYIILSSGSNTGSNTRTVFWERDVTRTNRWRQVPTVVQEPAYAAFLSSGGCPAGGSRAFQLVQGMPHTRLAPPVRGASLGRPVWAVAGTSGSSSERFSFRLLVDRANYRLDGYAETYVERVNGHVCCRMTIGTTYSRYGASFTITAPTALALHEAT